MFLKFFELLDGSEVLGNSDFGVLKLIESFLKFKKMVMSFEKF